MTQQPLPPAGWYPDPHDASRRRWWDGLSWTEHIAPQPAPTDLSGVSEDQHLSSSTQGEVLPRETPKQAVARLKKGRFRLGRGNTFPSPTRPKVMGVFVFDTEGLWVRRAFQDDALIIHWAQVETIEVDGSEMTRSSSRASYRKSFTVRHTRGTVSTTSAAYTTVVLTLANDEIGLRLDSSPVSIRAALGPIAGAIRERQGGQTEVQS